MKAIDARRPGMLPGGALATEAVPAARAARTPVPGIAALQGLWRRSLIAWPDRPADTTTTVRWLQGPSAYIDLRQPTPVPDFSHARALEDLSLEDCAWLARQEGFAGHLNFDGAHFEWIREIDFQPRSPGADAGSLEWEGNVLIETGRDADYVEHWHRDPSVPAAPGDVIDPQAQPHVAKATLLHVGPRTASSHHIAGHAAPHAPKATFLRVGPYFMFARERTVGLEKGYRSLAEYVAAALDLDHARKLVDCEISFGNVEDSGLRITASTLPYRIGALLDLGLQLNLELE